MALPLGTARARSNSGSSLAAWTSSSHLLPLGRVCSNAEDRFCCRVKAEDLPAIIEHKDARMHLLENRLARKWQGVEHAEAEHGEGKKRRPDEDASDHEVKRRGPGLPDGVNETRDAARDLPCQHQGHGPTMQR